MLNKTMETNTLIMKAYSLIQQTYGMVFVGIYSLDTYEPLALTDREKVCVSVTNAEDKDPASKFDVCLDPMELQAISTHIRTRDNALAVINISGLRFVCLRTGSKVMTGVSNFNSDVNLSDINNALFKITKKRYSDIDLAEGVHALQMSAIIREDKLVVGITKSEEESSLLVIKQMFEISDLQVRPSTKSDKDRRRDKVKRETSFCEDWRTATIRSIEALKRSRAFLDDDDIADDDDSPLITNIQPMALSPLPDVSYDWSKMPDVKLDENKNGEVTSNTGINRRPSRATMV